MKNFKELAKTVIEKYSNPNIVGNPCSDKGSNHAYEQFYPDVFEPYKDKVDLKILEVGVSIGYSLKMWAEIFPHAQIFGMDHDYSQLKLSEEEKKRFNLLPEGSQTDSNIFKDCPLFDIIIDDASHIPSLTLDTWNILKNKLAPNGLYVIEDVDPNDQAWTTTEYKDTFQFVDIRHIKNKHDDILYVYHNKV